MPPPLSRRRPPLRNRPRRRKPPRRKRSNGTGFARLAWQDPPAECLAMRRRLALPCFLSAALMLLVSVAATTQQPDQDGPPAGLEPLTRGPVHEAFAQLDDPLPG